MKIMANYLTGGPISAPATVINMNGNLEPTIIAGSDALYAWQAGDGRLLSGFPARGRNFFASRPLVVLPEQIGLPKGDGSPLIFAGNDDNSLYGFDWRGRLLPGFPKITGGDVYSSPAMADLDGDGVHEIVVGSDDGQVYAWRLGDEGDSGSHPLAGWPRPTGGFVSASPLLVDLDGDGALEVVAGSWDKCVYAWRADGALLPGWPRETGHFVWSASQAADLSGNGRPEIITAADGVYAWRADGRPLPGWPQDTTSYVVGTPAVADLTGDGRPEIVVAADRLYAWRADGTLLPDFPLDLGTFFWSAPVITGREGGAEPTIYVCGWDGHLYSITAGGQVAEIGLSDGPIFATPALADLDGDGRQELLVGAWDSRLYLVKCDPQEEKLHRIRPGSSRPVPPATTTTEGVTAAKMSTVAEAVAPFITFPGPLSSRATMYYQATKASDPDAPSQPGTHPVPLVAHRDRLTGLVQPFPAGTRVTFWAEINGDRHPASGNYGYRVVPDWRGRIRRRMRKWRAKQ
jgi:outer membrane protein assembly factor BamB